MSKKTLVIGASEKEHRYSNMAIELLQRFDHPVIAIGSRPGIAHGIKFDKVKEEFKEVDTISLYINSTIQESYVDYFLEIKPKRIIFNPGTENRSIYPMLNKANIETIEACTLVMLRTGQY